MAPAVKPRMANQRRRVKSAGRRAAYQAHAAAHVSDKKSQSAGEINGWNVKNRMAPARSSSEDP